jgi:hypothetical protein
VTKLKLYSLQLHQSLSQRTSSTWNVAIKSPDLIQDCKYIVIFHLEKAYIDYITEALDIFHKEVPRAFVNVVETINIGHVPLLNVGLICDTLHL